MTRSAWFDGPTPRILAHRGLAIGAPENGLAAMAAALAAGATHLETDVRATSDGRAVLVHDAAIGPVGFQWPVAGLHLRGVQTLQPAVCLLDDALHAFPDARFNIDVKARDAADPTADAVRAAGAIDRVLIASFSETRRAATVAALPGVATSAAGRAMLAAVLALRVGSRRGASAALVGVDAVQIPERLLGVDVVSERAIAFWHDVGVEVHVWVVNDVDRMRELVRRGADGIVTDRSDLARAALLTAD